MPNKTLDELIAELDSFCNPRDGNYSLPYDWPVAVHIEDVYRLIAALKSARLMKKALQECQQDLRHWQRPKFRHDATVAALEAAEKAGI